MGRRVSLQTRKAVAGRVQDEGNAPTDQTLEYELVQEMDAAFQSVMDRGVVCS